MKRFFRNKFTISDIGLLVFWFIICVFAAFRKEYVWAGTAGAFIVTEILTKAVSARYFTRKYSYFVFMSHAVLAVVSFVLMILWTGENEWLSNTFMLIFALSFAFGLSWFKGWERFEIEKEQDDI